MSGRRSATEAPAHTKNVPEAARTGTPEEQERTKALYYGEITYMDAMLGRLLNTLADLGRLEDTAVMVTSDHGTELLDHGRFGRSPAALYAHNTRLNWIVRLEDPNQQSTVGPCRVYFGSRPTRAEERAGFV